MPRNGATSEQSKRRQQMAKLRAIGLTDAEIGRRFFVSRQRVGQILGKRKQ